MGKVVITHEFDSVEAAIAALGKIAGIAPAAAAPKSDTPPVEKPPRRGRSDAGVPRGPHDKNAAGASAGANATATAGNSSTGTTDAGKATTQAANPQSTTPAAPNAPAATPPTAATTAPAATIADDTVQAAVEKLFNKIDYDGTFMALSKFGVKRGKDLPQNVRAEFLQRVEDLVAGKYGVGDGWPAY